MRARIARIARRLLGSVDVPAVPVSVAAEGAGAAEWAAIRDSLDEAKILSAKLLIRGLDALPSQASLAAAEFKVFSQFGDDGIIQFLIRRLDIPGRLASFVEFGVESYVEANTRFLLLNDNWRGLVMDGDADNIRAIQARESYWRHELTAACRWIDRDTIDAVLTDLGFVGEIGLLSVDIDGNDYWIWERITVVDPVIVIVEYNSVFGAERAVTVPYQPDFNRTAAHSSNLYWGASLGALVSLGRRKGYGFVGCNQAGNNAYFVRNDHLGRGGINAIAVADGYVESRFRESRDAEGRLTYLGGKARGAAIAGMPVYDVEADAIVALGTEN